MIATIGIIGLLGCFTAVCVAVAAAATVVSCVMAGVSYAQQKEAAADQRDLELDAQRKSENDKDAQNAIQARLQAKNSERLQAQMGSAVATEHLRAKRLRYQNAKARIQAQAEGTKGYSPTAKPTKIENSRNYGTPAAE
jgi:hypothetical protein